MFHLYFGAFDIVLYLGGTYAAMVLSKAICDTMDETESARAKSGAAIAPMQKIPAHLSAPATKQKDTPIQVSVNS